MKNATLNLPTNLFSVRGNEPKEREINRYYWNKNKKSYPFWVGTRLILSPKLFHESTDMDFCKVSDTDLFLNVWLFKSEEDRKCFLSFFKAQFS